MADKDRTPEDLLGSLLSGKKPAQSPESQPAVIPEGQLTGIPVSQPTSKPVRKKKEPVSRPAPAPAKKAEEAPGDKVKATFYLSTETVEDLETGWIQLRRLAPKETRGQVSKSLIVELALQIALEELKSKKDKSLLAKKASKP